MKQMTDYERGFNEGFAAALARQDRAPSNRNGGPDPTLTDSKVVPVRVRQDQLKFLIEYSAALGISMAAAVRSIIDQKMAVPK